MAGTTGYEFGDRVLGLFLDPEGYSRLLEFGARLARVADTSFAALSEQAKREVIDRSFSGDLDRLTGSRSAALDLEAPGHDLSLRDLRRAWAELTVHLAVYRTYLEEGVPTAPDRARLVAAFEAGDGRRRARERGTTRAGEDHRGPARRDVLGGPLARGRPAMAAAQRGGHGEGVRRHRDLPLGRACRSRPTSGGIPIGSSDADAVVPPVGVVSSGQFERHVHPRLEAQRGRSVPLGRPLGGGGGLGRRS